MKGFCCFMIFIGLLAVINLIVNGFWYSCTHHFLNFNDNFDTYSCSLQLIVLWAWLVFWSLLFKAGE